MTSSTIDLAALERRVRDALLIRYPGTDVGLEIGITAGGRLRIAIWPTRSVRLYNQWVYVDADGTVTFPEPDDGMTSIGAKPWWVHHTSGVDEAMQRVVELVDGAVAAAQQLVDQKHAALLVDRSSLAPTAEQVAGACDAWISSHERRRLLNACAWVQLGDWYYGFRNLLHSSLVDARRDPSAMGQAATLMRAINNAPVRTSEQWCTEIGSPAIGSAIMALEVDPTEDERISREVIRGLLHLPLWHVSLDPAGCSESDQPRWVFELTGGFRALPVSTHGGAGPLLICAGRYRVESVTVNGPTSHVQLSYQDRLGDGPVANPVLLDLAGRIHGVTSTRMAGPIALRGASHKESISLGLTGNRGFEATFDSQHIDRITTSFRPDGTFDGENLYTDSWKFAPGDGPTVATLPVDAGLIAAHLERLRDPRWLDCRKPLLSSLSRCWRTTGEPWTSGGSVDLPAGGYVQWTRVDDPGSDVHIEINEGEFADPMPAELVDLLVMLGWNAPNDDFRNCWLRAGPPERGVLSSDRQSFFGAANLILLGVTIAAGGSLSDLWSAVGGDEPEPPTSGRTIEITTGPTGSRRTMVITSSRDEKGWQRRELLEEADGTLVIEGHDLGSGVSDFWGAGLTEYEFTRTLSAAAVVKLRLALGIGDAPLLEALGSRFEGTADLERYVEENGIENTFWSRVGD